MLFAKLSGDTAEDLKPTVGELLASCAHVLFCKLLEIYRNIGEYCKIEGAFSFSIIDRDLGSGYLNRRDESKVGTKWNSVYATFFICSSHYWKATCMQKFHLMFSVGKQLVFPGEQKI